MKQIFLVFSGVLFLSLSGSSIYGQSELPGSAEVKSVYEISEITSNQQIELCCFAAYGWHFATELKFEVDELTLLGSGDNIAERLLQSEIMPLENEQFFKLSDGRYVVVSSQSTFDKVFGRYLINMNATKPKKQS
ncbi:MAG TPA: hypothetical protein EYN67_20055 [Flavobacteriales bacterium]|nr:hypothetical protein [Flavobacteriales bacterium]HIN41187.1 hypothetical protein [Flavobacteriales bacterium]